MSSDLTPMMAQYRELKRQHPDSLLLFRLGDFYEMFESDAERGAAALSLTLTSRPTSKGARIPMCGLPAQALPTYVARLVRQGHRVAICDQMEDPAQAKGLVRREVTRVVSSGTVVEPAQLDAGANNYIAALDAHDGRLGLSYADLTTGEWAVREWPASEATALADELARLAPSESLLTESAEAAAEIRTAVAGLSGCAVRGAPGPERTPRRASERLTAHLGAASLSAYGCADLPSAIRAAAALLDYLAETQRGALAHLDSLRTERDEGTLVLDAAATRHLELVANARDGGRGGTLLSVLDATRTAMGARLLRRWLLRPLRDVRAIRVRQSAVAELVEAPDRREKLRSALRSVTDFERTLGRIGTGVAHPRDLVQLGQALAALPEVLAALSGVGDARLSGLRDETDPLADVRDRLASVLRPDAPAGFHDGGVIREGVSAELDEIRRASAAGKEIIAGIQTRERGRTGIESLKVQYNQVFGYYIEVTRPNLPKVPSDYVRRQTTSNAERFVTEELKEHEERVLGADQRVRELEAALYLDLRAVVARELPRVRAAAERVAELDVLAALAEVAERRGYVRPEVDDSAAIRIRQGRHPVVETVLPPGTFVANDTLLDAAEDHLLVVLTGPNMAGKSTYMRQVALIVLLAQTGSFVPAAEARIGVADRIFTRVGASDSIATGQSTFMVEMTETAEILRHATERSLVVFDEVGRGTSTFDGISIAWGVAEAMARKLRARTLFATHFYELTELALTCEKVKNYNVAVREWQDEVVFLRRIEPGSADRSYGIQVARLAGLPGDVLARAREILHNLERLNYTDEGRSRLAQGEDSGQLSLFKDRREEQEVIAEIERQETDRMTPMEALARIQAWRARLASGGRSGQAGD